MKCFILLAALCSFGVCAGQGLDLNFITDNLLNPLIDQIYNNAIDMLGQQLTQLLGGLFGGIGKRSLSDLINVNVSALLAPFIAQVKEIYQRVFATFLQIVQNIQSFIEKPDWARIEFVRAGADAEMEVARINIGVDVLQPLVALVQTHLGALINEFQSIIALALDAAKHPVQSLIGAGSLLQP